MAHLRADVALAEAGLFPSREKARAAILEGRVSVGGVRLAKAGQSMPAGTVEVVPEPEYVSRGGHKLAGALDTFGLPVEGLRAIDVGASTGGFTDVLLQRGAASVAAVDVGYGQLAWRLREDRRVAVFERTNIRKADPAALGAPFDIAVIDVAFIGLAKVLPAVEPMLAEDGQILALVKPQFEAGKGSVGKRGVVKDPAVHADVLRRIASAVEERELVVRGLSWSPIKGPEGNIEFWAWIARSGASGEATPEEVVRAAHDELDRQAEVS